MRAPVARGTIGHDGRRPVATGARRGTVELRVVLIVERHASHHDGWVRDVCTVGRHALIVHRRVVRLREATTIATTVVEVTIAITIAVLAVGGVSRMEVTTARERPIEGLWARVSISRTLNGALDKGTAVHVEEVKVILVVFLEVLSVRSER